MFVNAIETAVQFTRSLHSISRNYGSDIVQTGAVTLFIVNSNGWALTCKHVAQTILDADNILKKRQSFENELAAIKGQKNEKNLHRQLEQKYGYLKGETFELFNLFHNCVDKSSGYELRLHPTLDVALIHFQGFTTLMCDVFPIFPKQSEIKQGKFLCRLGFPFAEFSNYAYDAATNKISWTNTGRTDTPRFPIEGMVTRHLVLDGKIIGFEMSTPGLRGQSGGPAFDANGKIWGMQSATAHLDLDFDINQEVLRNGKKKRVSDSAFLHVGHCIHVDVLKEFMRQHNVEFRDE